MKPSAFICSLLLSVTVYSTDTMSATDADDGGYTIQTVTGELPIRNVIVKRAGEYFTTFFAYQFDCTSKKSSQTGFYSSAEAAQAELANTTLSNSIYSALSDQARLKACEPDSNIGVSSSAQPPSAS